MSELWEVAGPIIIGIIATLITALICWIILKLVPSNLQEPIKKISAFVVVIAFGYSIYVAAGIWAWI